MQTLLESNYSLVLVCTPCKRISSEEVLIKMIKRALQHRIETERLKEDKNCHPSDLFSLVCTDVHGMDTVLPVNLGIVSRVEEAGTKDQILKFIDRERRVPLFCVALYNSERESCLYGSQRNELLHFELLAADQQARLQQQNQQLESAVHQLRFGLHQAKTQAK